MLHIHAKPLTAQAFAAYGHVTDHPGPGNRIYMDKQLFNQRPVAAKTSMSIACIHARSERPLPLSVIERHEFSSQSFIPLDEGRYLVIAAPKNSDGSADVTKIEAFIATSAQSMTYNANIWHGPMTPLDGPMRFAIIMFNDGGSGDEELIRHGQPFAMAAL